MKRFVNFPRLLLTVGLICVVHMPKLAYAIEDHTVNHVLISGQSLSLGYGGQPILSNTRSSNHLMFGSLHWPDYRWFSPLRAWVYETVAHGMAEGVTNMLDDSGATERHSMLVTLSGRGGKTIHELSQAGGDPYNVYANGLYAMWAASFQSGYIGRPYRASAVAWLQGESDELKGTSSAAYSDALIRLQQEYSSDAMALTGTGQRMVLLTYQTNVLTIKNQPPGEIAEAQLIASDLNPDIYVVSPIYPFEYVDGLHLNNHGYRHLGGYFAKAYKQVVIDEGQWRPLRAVEAIAKGKMITVDFHVPEPPLVFDTDQVTDPGNYGFVVEDAIGKVKIREVVLSGPTEVSITLARELSGVAELRYAYDGPAYESISRVAGKYLGSRGNLRDSDSTTGFGLNAAGQPYPLPNWCVAFKMEITPDESRKGSGRP